MNNTPADRIRKRMTDLKFKQVDLMFATGATKGAVSKWLSGANVPNGGYLIKLANFLRTNANYILTGEGDENALDPSPKLRLDDEGLVITLHKERQLPILNWIKAGMWADYYDDAIADDFEIVFDDGRYGRYAYCLIIEGNSMVPDFNEGDIIYVDPEVTPKAGDYVVATLATERKATFKKYRPKGFDENGVEYCHLVPSNPDYPVIDSRFVSFEICAVAMDVKKKLR